MKILSDYRDIQCVCCGSTFRKKNGKSDGMVYGCRICKRGNSKIDTIKDYSCIKEGKRGIPYTPQSSEDTPISVVYTNSEESPVECGKALESSLNGLPKDWDIISKLIRQRDKNTCKSCGLMVRLSAHHIIPRDEGGSNEPRNLITLCECCHNRIEVNRIQNWDEINGYWKRCCYETH